MMSIHTASALRRSAALSRPRLLFTPMRNGPQHAPLTGPSRDVSLKASADTPYQDIPTPEDLKPLFEPFSAGSLSLDTRVVYGPLTRCRAIGGVPAASTAQYYGDRAQKGQLVVTEATTICANAHGYPNTPGIYTDEQMAAWKPVVDAVKAKGAVFFCQIWHTGRASHTVYNADGSLPVAPSAVAIASNEVANHPETFEELKYETPRALEIEEIPEYVEYFRQAARNAVDLGFDGVQIHAGNGYLIDQFLRDCSNRRTDQYGGSIENRTRFLLEIVDACVKEIGADRVGVRFTPFSPFLDMKDSNVEALFTHAVLELNKRNIAFVDFTEPRVSGNSDRDAASHESVDGFRKAATVPVSLAGGYVKETAAEALRSGRADMITMGRWALANPDLLKRWKLGAPLNKYDRPTFYTPGNEGYIDYPLLQDTEYGKEYLEA